MRLYIIIECTTPKCDWTLIVTKNFNCLRQTLMFDPPKSDSSRAVAKV